MSNYDSLFQRMSSLADSQEMLVPIGMDDNGEFIYRSLKNMHHLLIGGTTGAGKTSYILTVLASLIARHSPKEIRLIIIDTKSIDYSAFVGIPHMFLPVITETARMENVLKWVSVEIRTRLKKMSDMGARDIDGYNSFCLMNAENPLPSLVVVIDDLAFCRIDNSLLENLKDLLRNGRAADVHVIMSSSSPSTRKIRDDIIPMFPCRAAFKVISSADSRVLLDKNGAENLIAPYEMIYKDMLCTSKCRTCFIPFDEVKQVLRSSKEQYSVIYDFAEPIPKREQTALANSEDSAILDSAAKIVIEAGYASVSLLQRKLNLGYPVASRIIDALEKQGLIGPFRGSKPRAVLLSMDDWNNRSENKYLNKKEELSQQRKTLASLLKIVWNQLSQKKKEAVVPKEKDDSENKPDTILRPFAKQRIGDCEVAVENNHLTFIKHFSERDSLKHFNNHSPVSLNGSFSGDALLGIKAKYSLSSESLIKFIFKDSVTIDKTSDHLDNIDRPCLLDLLEVHFSAEYIKVAKAFVRQISEDCGILPEETDLTNVSNKSNCEQPDALPKPSYLPSQHTQFSRLENEEIRLREFINTKIGDCTIDISDNTVHFYREVLIEKQRNGRAIAEPGTLPGSFSGKQLKRIEVLYSKYLRGYIRFFFAEKIKNAKTSPILLDGKESNEADILEIHFYNYQREVVESLVQQIVEDTGVPFSEEHDDKKPEASNRKQMSILDLLGEIGNQIGDAPSPAEPSKDDSSNPDSPPPIAPSSSGGGFPPSPHNPFKPWR